jgi:hypothetical protein
LENTKVVFDSIEEGLEIRVSIPDLLCYLFNYLLASLPDSLDGLFYVFQEDIFLVLFINQY